MSGVGASRDGNTGYVMAETNVTRRCWGCPHTAWGYRGLILIINQISLILAQTHCSSPFPAIRSTLT